MSFASFDLRCNELTVVPEILTDQDTCSATIGCDDDLRSGSCYVEYIFPRFGFTFVAFQRFLAHSGFVHPKCDILMFCESQIATLTSWVFDEYVFVRPCKANIRTTCNLQIVQMQHAPDVSHWLLLDDKCIATPFPTHVPTHVPLGGTKTNPPPRGFVLRFGGFR